MTKNIIKDLIDCTREIEFDYENQRYSITYYNDNRTNYISFCRFYEKPIDVKNVDELLSITINGISLESILLKLPDSAIDIF